MLNKDNFLTWELDRPNKNLDITQSETKTLNQMLMNFLNMK